MPISTVIGLLAALIGSTATLLGAWAYIRSQHPPKGELFRATLAITIIMAIILGLAMLISNATTISINGQQTLPLPPVPVPGFSTPGRLTPSPTSVPKSAPSPSPTSVPTSTPSPSPELTPTPAPSPSPELTPSPVPSPTSAPSPAPNPTKTRSANVDAQGHSFR
jgi:hypothetical protein